MAAKQEMSPKLWFLEAVYSGSLARLETAASSPLLFSHEDEDDDGPGPWAGLAHLAKLC